MFSKKKPLFIVLVGFLVSVVGCSDFLNGKKEQPKVIEISDAKFECLQNLPGELNKFLEGDAKESEVTDGFNCLSESLKTFNKRTYGATEGAYTSEELRKFFGKYFLKQNNITPEFAAELMKIKRILLGGSDNYITKDEILKLVDMLGHMRDEFIKLAPHMKILLFHSSRQELDPQQINTSVEQLRESLQRFVSETQVASVDYGFSDVEKILQGFAEFTKNDSDVNPYVTFSDWLPTVQAVKNVLIGSNVQISGLPLWHEAIDTFVDLYNLSVRHYYFLRGIEIDNAAKLDLVSDFIAQSIKLLQNTHQLKNLGRIPSEDIDVLIERILPRLKISVRAESLKKAYRVILLKILDPEKSGKSQVVLGLEKKHLVNFQREFNVWRLNQSFVNSLSYADKNSGPNTKELLNSYSNFNKTYVIEKVLTKDPLEQFALELSWKDLGELLKIPLPANFDGQGKFLIHKNIGNIGQTWSSLTKANLMRELSRLLILGYGQNADGSLTDAYLKEKDLISWYDDFKELGIDLKAFDPRSANSGSRSFLEANFFTFSGNGDDSMDQKETYEFLSFLFSAGLSSSEAIRLDLNSSQCLVQQKDVFGYPYVLNSCFKNLLKEKFAMYFNNLPGLVEYVKSLDKTQWDYFYYNLFMASWVDGQQQNYIETANIRTMVMILHYIESIFAVFDSNGDQGLSLEEVYVATPRFMSFIKMVSPVNWESIMTEGFAYLVFKGKVPDLIDLGKFEIEKVVGLRPAQRTELVRLFGTLKDQLNKQKK